MRQGVSGGFALAVLPLAETVLATDAQGLEAGDVEITTPSGEIPAYHAHPKGDPKKKYPVLLVVHEIFGVHEHIADVCRRFAKQGYLAIAPDLYVRQGDPTKYQSMQQLNEEVVSKVPDSQVMADLDATFKWAGEHDGDVNKVGINGFCWGGRITWLYAEHNPRLKAAVAWYGGVVGNQTPMTPANPIDRVSDLQVPVLGLYGRQDQSIPQDSLEKMKQAIAQGPQAGRGTQFVVYDDAGHAFFADYRPSYRRADAEDGWKRALAWFKEHGVG